MPTPAKTPAEYLNGLPDDRKAAMRKIRAAINKGLPKGYKEGIQYGMIGWFVPHSRYPDGYHCDAKQPVPFASIASQKNHMGIYLFCIYTDAKESARFVKEWKKTGHKLDMGKSCIRVKNIESVPLELLTETVSRIPVDAFLREYEKQIPASKRKKKAAKKKAVKKKKAAAKKRAAPKKKAATKKKAVRKKAVRKKAAARRR